ncbi:MAG TPA: polymer-forming cytoskeletal protein [Stellaceae bacterium]|nr:polymer-forming cytoskeletal protein [Stellaceae bacterium]
MWFKQSPANSDDEQGGRSDREPAAPSILSSDLKIEGDVVSQGDLHINGSIKGDVVAHRLTLGEGGSITGTVEVDVAVIAGNLAGQITATSVTLASTARVVADITHVSLLIEEGAVFEGFSRRVDTIEGITEDTLRSHPRLNPPLRAAEHSA